MAQDTTLLVEQIAALLAIGIACIQVGKLFSKSHRISRDFLFFVILASMIVWMQIFTVVKIQDELDVLKALEQANNVLNVRNLLIANKTLANQQLNQLLVKQHLQIQAMILKLGNLTNEIARGRYLQTDPPSARQP